MLQNMGQVLQAIKKGDMKLAQSLPLPEVKDVRMETIKKVEAAKVAWQLYKEPMWTKFEVESQFSLARRWLDDFYQQLQYQNTLVGNRDKIRYHNHLDNVKPTITDNRVTLGYNIHTAQYDILVKYGYAVDRNHFNKCCVKTISSSSIDVFNSIRKTLKIGAESGLSRDQLVELLLEIVKDEIKGLKESIENREMTADEIFYRITSCMSEEKDLEKIQMAIMKVKRQPGQPLSMVMNLLERLHLELLQCLLPFQSLSSLEERNKHSVLELMGEFTEPATADQINSYIKHCNNINRPYTIKDVIYFADQYETMNQKKPKSTKSIGAGTFKANAFFTNMTNNVMMAAQDPRKQDEKKAPRGFGQKPQAKQQRQNRPNTRGSGVSSSKDKTGDASGGKKPVNAAKKTGNPTKRNAANKADNGKNGSKNICKLCGYKCHGSVDYKNLKCKLFPNTKLADKTCGLCGKGRHVTSSNCYEMFRMFSGQGN